MAFAATPALSDVAGQDCEDAVNVLTELGVVQGYPDGTYKPDKVVTRAEMAVIVVSALGLEDYAVGTAKFSDMAGHWSNGYVAYATSLGIIAGYPDGTFKPDKTVSYDEAATMLVAALGYNADSLVGTWPANFVTKAKSLGILDGVKAGAAGAVRGDIATMTYQTLDQAIGKTNKDGDFIYDKDASNQPKDTMLARLGAKLYKPDGKNAGDAFIMTDKIADNAKTNVKNYIGAYVTAYANDKNKIIAIKEVKSTFLKGEVTAVSAGGAITEFKADGVKYTVERVDYETPAVVANEFINGVDQAVASYSGFAVNDELTLAAKVSGVKVKEIYSISKWDLSGAWGDHFLFEKGDLEAKKINGNLFTLDDNDKIDLSSFALVGVDSLEDIAVDDVVYVYRDANSSTAKITRIEVGTEVVKGEITRVQSSEYTINGTAYGIAGQTNVTLPGTILDVKNKVEVKLDVNGDIYDAEKISGESTLAVLLDKNVPTSSLAGDAKVELFLPDGTEKVFVVDTDEVTNLNTATFTPHMLVEYSVDNDGVIDSLVAVTGIYQAVDQGTDSKITINKSGYVEDATAYKIASDAFIIVDADVLTATTFQVETSADGYSVSKLADILDASYDDILYTLNTDNEIDIIIIEGAGTTDDAVYGLLTDTFTTSDWNRGVELLIDGVVKEYNASTPPTAGNYAYLYKITFNTKGEAVMAYLDKPADTMNSAETTGSSGFTVTKNVASNSTDSFQLASDVIVYTYDAIDGWDVGDKNDIVAAKTCAFYDTEDDDVAVATIVLVY
ncbi:MAG: S-layer homology domain-containing protein [Anaerovoracaceae bacterium]